ncbi:MAG: SulP family inorganic anion transporter [Gaiellaceae bacterium]
MQLAPWLRGYRRAWLVPDVLAGLIVWTVVVPQAVAYAQIAGLPPSAGLAAAPGALLAYALLGTSRSLVVSATTATSALSAAAVGPLADGDVARFAALSAALAVVAAIVLILAGLVHAGKVMDFVPTTVMTGFLFGLGLVVSLGQLPKIFGVEEGSGDFFEQLRDLVEELDDTHTWTLVVGAASVVGLVALGRLAPKLPGTLIVLVGAIVASAALDLAAEGVDVVGKLPDAAPDFAIPDVSWGDLADLLPAALGVMIVSAEAAAVSRSIASSQGYEVDVNRDIVALGGSNLLAGFSSGFVQSGGASQTLAAERAGGRTQLVSLVAAALILLTGLFLAPLFEDLPQATLAAIVIVAIANFFRVRELGRFAHLRRTAIVLALVALFGVLLFGVLPGLLLAVALSLFELLQRLSTPQVAKLVRDPATGAWGNRERHPGWASPPRGVLVVGVEGPLFYANSAAVKNRVLELAAEHEATTVVLDLARNDELDVQALDMLGELVGELAPHGVELRLAAVRARVLELLRRSGLAARVCIESSIDAAI